METGINVQFSLSVGGSKPDPLAVLATPKAGVVSAESGKSFARQNDCQFLDLAKNEDGGDCWRLAIDENKFPEMTEHSELETCVLDFDNPVVESTSAKIVRRLKAAFHI